jgi:hypothetical protein
MRRDWPACESRRLKNGSQCPGPSGLASYLLCCVETVTAEWISDRATSYTKTGEERNPTSDCADREVIVRFQLGRNMASSSLFNSPSSEDPEEVVILAANESGVVELRAGGL